MPPPNGGKLEARRRVVPKLPRYYLRLDGAQVADYSIPVVVRLDRPAARGAHSLRQLRIREQAANGVGERRRVFRRNEESRLPLAYRVRHAPRVSRDHREPARRRFDQRDPEPLHADPLGAARRADVDRRLTVQRGEIALAHVPEEAHPPGHAQSARELLELLPLRRGPRPRNRIADVGSAREDRRQRLEHRLDRKSTRLNSSHSHIPYAGFFLLNIEPS